MLVLARRISESIVINGDIIITVLGIKGSQIRVGVTAPKNTEVDREEIYLKKQQNGTALNKVTNTSRLTLSRRLMTSKIRNLSQ